jgi:hypothetical protein
MAHAASGSLAERLLRRLGIQVGGDGILRQMLRGAQVCPPPVRLIGTADWSWRKSQTYRTKIIDLKRLAVIDVLENRDVVTCTDWLRRHLEIEVISRDRCGLYAQANRQGAPQVGTGRRPVSRRTNPSHGDRGANELARSSDRLCLALRSRQHQHGQPQKLRMNPI